jgi:hypothetical protein
MGKNNEPKASKMNAAIEKVAEVIFGHFMDADKKERLKNAIRELIDASKAPSSKEEGNK